MKNVAWAGWLALCASGTVVAQSSTLEQVQKDLEELKSKNERLESEVEYLKEQTKFQRRDAAEESVAVEALKSATGKFTWSGDFRYRNEQIKTAPNSTTDEHTRGRDRIRLRFGVTAKISDSTVGRFQIGTSGGTAGDPRSTNQTLGEDWSRKSIGIDLAYVDWKALNGLNLQLGKMPQPWTRTASYMWDGDITPEGAALKYVRGGLFATGFYNWLNERHSGSATGLRSDTKLVGAQVGWRQPIGPMTLTVAGAVLDLTNVQDEQVSANNSNSALSSNCRSANGVFFGNSTNGNSVYTATYTNASGTCSVDRLQSDFTQVNLLAQLDFTAGRYPMAVFAEYTQNTKAESVSPSLGKLDTAYAVGVSLNKASNPKTWEAGLVYQMSEADAIFGQFHDSDFGDGRTDTSGFAIKGAYAPAANWTVSGTLLINKLNRDTGSATTTDLDYKRLQLDMNYKF